MANNGWKFGESTPIASPGTVYPVLRLSAAIMTQAYKDVLEGEPETALDALFWLAFDDTPEWIVELLDIAPGDLLEPVYQYKKMKRRKIK